VSSHCDRARQWASAEVDGRLSDFERALLQAHLGGCDECRAFRESIQGFTSALRSSPLETPEHPVAVPRIRARPRFRIAPAVAALAVTAVGIGSIFTATQVRPGSEGAPAPTGVQLQTPSLRNGPINLVLLRGSARASEVAAARTVDTSRSSRLIGGPVLK
jgi:predicted anti-sigma-YlaC factor YlaD